MCVCMCVSIYIAHKFHTKLYPKYHTIMPMNWTIEKKKKKNFFSNLANKMNFYIAFNNLK